MIPSTDTPSSFPERYRSPNRIMTDPETTRRGCAASTTSFLERRANLEIDAFSTFEDFQPTPHEPRIVEGAFRREMERLWAERGCHTVDSLPEEWCRILRIFNDALVANYHHRGPTTRIYAGQLGLGKSMSAQVALATLAAYFHKAVQNMHGQGVGGILVVERVEMAEEAVRTINNSYRRISGCNDDCAITKHSKNNVQFSDLEEHPILVITHEAYRISLNRLAEHKHGTWNSYTTFRGGRRLLTIVDEAFNPVQDFMLSSEDVRLLLSLCLQADPDLADSLAEDAEILLRLHKRLKAIEEAFEAGESVKDTSQALTALVEGGYDLQPMYKRLLTPEALQSIARVQKTT
jgi:hypothetical protein